VPSATWWNLPTDKRARVTHAAMCEFGAKGFSAGSLNVIAGEAGIAKGSLFQYFDDKLDMFITICEYVSSEVGLAVLGVVDASDPLFENLRRVVAKWMAYFREHPLERQIAHAAHHELDPDVRSVVRAVPDGHHQQAFGPLVQAARDRGELRAEVDDRMVLSTIGMVLRHINSAPFDRSGDVAIPWHEFADQEVDRWALAYVDVLEAAFGV